MGVDLSLGRIPVCMRCGSRAVRHQSRGEGLWPGGGEGVAWVCESCHHIGAPFLLDREATVDEPAWRAEFAAAVAAVEDDEWNGTPAHGERGAILGVVFMVLGLASLGLFAVAVERAARGGGLFPMLGTTLIAGWLAALGLALFVVGLRRVRHGPSDEDTP